ncbi:MAG: prolipoprotein diacylglyceryl transferase [Candidatus Xenobium sp.]|jgi:phosphatidylglycerol:prolipoprotein diacylglycerol transferase|nr:prolipoprotein diacylglyceryl transferase [Burkholderiales bacterium]
MHPVLFRLGDFPLYTYGLIMAIAFLVGGLLTIYLGTRRGYEPIFTSDVVLWSILIGLLGARVAFALQNLDDYLQDPLLFLNFRRGGIAIQGGMLGGFGTAAWLFARRAGSARDGLDILAAPALLGMALGRVGCVMHGCCYGKVCQVPWGLVYPEATGLGSLPRHPVQFYEMGLDLILMGFVLWVFLQARFAGQAFWVSFGGYGLIRLLTEFFREGAMTGPMTLAQWVSLLFLAVGVLGVLGLWGRPEVRWAGGRPPEASGRI